MHQLLLTLHVLAATVWTGGHLILTIRILPDVLKNSDIKELLKFEAMYERIGMPALAIQVISGFWMAYNYLPDISEWFGFDSPMTRLLGFKLILLGLTAALAVDARLRLIPALTEETLPAMAWHIIAITLCSVLFVVVGVAFRF